MPGGRGRPDRDEGGKGPGPNFHAVVITGLKTGFGKQCLHGCFHANALLGFPPNTRNRQKLPELSCEKQLRPPDGTKQKTRRAEAAAHRRTKGEQRLNNEKLKTRGAAAAAITGDRQPGEKGVFEFSQ